MTKTLHLAGDQVPTYWYEIEFKEGESLKDYPDFTFEFIHDCASIVENGERKTFFTDSDKEVGYLMYLNGIDNANFEFNPPLSDFYTNQPYEK